MQTYLERLALFVLTLCLLSHSALLALEGEDAANPNIGRPAPKIKVSEWIRGPNVDVDALQDKPYVVEFWATWCPPCRRSIPHLNHLARIVQPLGMTVMGLSKEDADTVRPFAADMNMVYSVGAGDETSGLDFQGIPFAAVIGADNTVAWAGHPMDPAFDQAVSTQLGALWPEQPGIVAAAAAGNLGEVYEALKTVDTPNAAQAAAQIETSMADALRAAAEQTGLEAFVAYGEILDTYEGLPGLESVAGKRDAIRQEPEAAKVITEYEATQKLEATIEGLREEALRIREEKSEHDATVFFMEGLISAADAFLAANPEHPEAAKLKQALPMLKTRLESLKARNAEE